MIGLAWLGVIRGIVYLAGACNAGYKIPAAIDIVFDDRWQLGVAVSAWIITGLLLAASTLTGHRLWGSAALLIGVKTV